jgi:formylglycine-generating enzyme required for sulfatase activity
MSESSRAAAQPWTCRRCGAENPAPPDPAATLTCRECATLHLDARSEPPRDLTGRTLGAFELGEPAHACELGQYYYGTRLSDGKAVFVLALGARQAEDPQLVARFKKALLAAREVTDEHLAAVLTVGEEEAVPYGVWDYVAGESVAGRLAREHLFPPDMARLAGDLSARALCAVHGAGLVWGVLRPRHFILCGSEVVKLLGLGAASLLIDHPHRFLTPEADADPECLFAAPETLRDAALSPAADLYSLGAVLFAMLTGVPPYVARGYGELTARHEQAQPPSPRFYESSVPAELADIVKKTLATDPAGRYAQAENLRVALDALSLAPSEPSGAETAETAELAEPPETAPAPAAAETAESLETAEAAGEETPESPEAEQAPAEVPGPEAAETQPAGATAAETAPEEAWTPPPPPEAAAEPGWVPPPPPSPEVQVELPASDMVATPGYAAAEGAEVAQPLQEYPLQEEPELDVPGAVAARMGVRPKDPRRRRRLIGLAVLSGVFLLAVGGLLGRKFYRHYQQKMKPLREMRAALPAGLEIRADTVIRLKDNAQMTYIPAGSFQMGAHGQGDNTPQHAVWMDGYFIDTFEVTVRQFKAFCEATGHAEPIASDIVIAGKHYSRWSCQRDYRFKLPEQPISGVSWRDAQAYAIWVGGDLPTEAQWEKAGRGTLGRRYPWGNRWSPTACNAGFPGDGHEFTARVGAVRTDRSPFGCFDMAGNVTEWCRDFYDPNVYRTHGENPRNPTGPPSGNARVYRGGSYVEENERNCQVYRRFYADGEFRDPTLGFRVVVPPKKRAP